MCSIFMLAYQIFFLKLFLPCSSHYHLGLIRNHNTLYGYLRKKKQFEWMFLGLNNSQINAPNLMKMLLEVVAPSSPTNASKIKPNITIP